MKIQDIIIWVLFIISIVVVLWYIFGSSPTIEQAILILIVTFLFKIQANMTSNNTELKNLKRRFNILESSFIKLAKDFKEHIRKK